MRRTAGITALGALIAGLVLLVAPGSASAAAVSATATDVALQAAGSCGPNPQMLISGQGVGDGFGDFGSTTFVGDPAASPSITPSPLFDDWSFSGQAFGLVPSSTPGPGDVVGGFALVSNADFSVSASWFVLWRCGTGPDSGTVLYTCTGRIGACPESVEEAQHPAIATAPETAVQGSAIEVTVSGCWGGNVAVGLWVSGASDPVVSTGSFVPGFDSSTRTLVVPTGTAPGPAQLVMTCDLSTIITSSDIWILAGPTSPAAPPVETAPAFTG